MKILEPWRDQACQTGNSCFNPASSGAKTDSSHSQPFPPQKSGSWGRGSGNTSSLELLAALGAAVFLAQGPPRHTARAIRIFRGIMIVEWKHICPQKSLIFPAVTNQLAGSGGSQRHQEPKLKRKKMQKVKANFRQVNLLRGCGARQSPRSLGICAATG